MLCFESLHLVMFFNKSKPKLELHYRIIGLKPFTDYTLIDLSEMQAFLGKVIEKVYSQDELALIIEKYLNENHKIKYSLSI